MHVCYLKLANAAHLNAVSVTSPNNGTVSPGDGANNADRIVAGLRSVFV